MAAVRLFRSLLFFAAMVVLTLGFATAVVLAYPLAFSVRSRLACLWARSCLYALNTLCGLGFRVQGIENLPNGGRIIFSNHQSAWETIALLYIIPGPQTWVLKRELLWVPLFGWALAAVGSIAIDRRSGKRAVARIIERGKACLAHGRSVIIFPEGTRVPVGSERRWGKGGALLASASGYPVVPVAHNAGVFWSRRGILKYPGMIQVVIGPAIDSKGLGAEQINRQAKAWIDRQLAELPTHWRSSTPSV